VFVNLHAILILASLLAPIIVVAFSPGLRPRPLGRVLIAISPILVVGVVCLLLLSAAGIPVAEWTFPLVGLTIAGLCVKSERAFQALRWSLFGVALALSAHGAELRGFDYASDARLARTFEAMEQRHLAALQDEVRKLPADKVFSEGPVAQVVDHPAKWNRRTFRPLWHTLFTGLYWVDSEPGEFWYSGGPAGKGQVEWRPD